MLRVRVEDLKPGMCLARPIPTAGNSARYLLQRGTELTDAMIRHLAKRCVLEVWVRCDELEFLEETVDAGLLDRQRELYGQLRQNFERTMRLSDAHLDFEVLKSGVCELFEYLTQEATSLVYLDKVQAFDDYLMAHSANVCYLSLLLGMKLDWYLIEQRRSVSPREAKDIVALGLGCLLHDIGKLRVDRAILDKPGRLTDSEMEEIRQHPRRGYQMVRSRVPMTAAQVVLHHHQRWNGTGYPPLACQADTALPALLEGNRIGVFARIATVADVFDAATSKRVYSDAKLSVQVLSEMRKYNAGFFDPIVERAFCEIIPPFPIGTAVRLNTGFEAVVVDFSADVPCRPRVKPIRYPDGEKCQFPDTIEIDLADHPDLEIHFVGQTDVRPYLFDPPAPPRQQEPLACFA